MRVVCLLDRSSSMFGKVEEMAQGVNAFLRKLAGAHVTIVTFNSSVETIFSGFPSEDVVSAKQLAPRGWTRLYDALGPQLERAAPGTTIFVATDGEDTESSAYTRERVAELLEQAKARGVKFIFLAEGPEAFAAGVAVGLEGEGVLSVEASAGLGEALASQEFIESASQHAMEEWAPRKRAKGEGGEEEMEFSFKTLNSPSV